MKTKHENDNITQNYLPKKLPRYTDVRFINETLNEDKHILSPKMYLFTSLLHDNILRNILKLQLNQ